MSMLPTAGGSRRSGRVDLDGPAYSDELPYLPAEACQEVPGTDSRSA